MTGHFAPSGRMYTEALPAPSAYFSVILRGHASTPRDEALLLEGTGLSPGTLSARTDITLGQQLRQIRNAARLLEPTWALQTGAVLSAATHGHQGIAIVCAQSMAQGLQTLTRFAHLRAPHFRFRGLLATDSEVRIVPEQRVALLDEERWPLLDLVMLSTQAVIEAQLGRPMHEARFEFPYPAPEHAQSYADFYHAPVRFGCREAAIVVPSKWLSVESPFADPTMHHAALQQLHLSAGRFQGDRLLVARVEQLLARRGARVGMSQVARLLGISERTLTRRLSGQGTSYQALSDNSLKSRSLALLHDQELSVAEVAYSLGYQDAANFGRAFRRWFGESPGKYRSTMEPDEFDREVGRTHGR